jgi:anti-sigma factor RsiW
VNCAEAGSFIPAYCDGELAGIDREQVERHIATCDVCAARSRLAARFKAAVRAHLPRPPVPTALRLRIREALGDQELAPRRWPWLTHPRLVPAAAMGTLLVLITLTVRHNQSAVFSQAQRSYRTELPMDVVGSDCGSIASWFTGRVDFPFHAPSLGTRATCQGGRLMNVGERPAAYVTYRATDGHRIAFLVFNSGGDDLIEAPQRRVVKGREIYIGTGPGVATAAYRDRGLDYFVTADYDEDELTRVVSTSWPGH